MKFSEKYNTYKLTTYIFISIFLLIGLKFHYQYLSKNYIINPSDLYLIDSFQTKGEVFKHWTKSKNKFPLNFESNNYYKFYLSSKIENGLIERERLYDTLLTEPIVVIYSDKDNYLKYKSTRDPFEIEVLQIKVHNFEYVDLNKNNVDKANGLLLSLKISYSLMLLTIIFRKRIEQFLKNSDVDNKNEILQYNT